MARAVHRKATNHPPDDSPPEHVPVLLKESIDLLQCKPGAVFIDATLGLGGHALAILERIQPGGTLIGIDRDEESLDKARARLEPFKKSVRLFHENYKNLPLLLNNLGLKQIDGMIVDLGVSSLQLLSPARGFSFHSDDLLDMRMDRDQRLTAADLVNGLAEEELADIIYRYGEERLSRRVAAAIVAAREQKPITRCSQLAEIVARATRVRGFPSTHPATRTFQALRIAVNEELEGLEEFFTEAVSFLKPGGRIAAIAFHSLEDRIVKRVFRLLSGQCVCERPRELCMCPRVIRVNLLTTRAVKPGAAELESNPRARSARLRAVEKLDTDLHG
jgi:16S rRNA (cytosine1402-N4)-methyltransferase